MSQLRTAAGSGSPDVSRRRVLKSMRNVKRMYGMSENSCSIASMRSSFGAGSRARGAISWLC